MLRGALIKFDQTVFLRKNCYRSSFRCTRNASPKINMDCRQTIFYYYLCIRRDCNISIDTALDRE